MEETQCPLSATEEEASLLDRLVALAENVKLLILEGGKVRPAKSAKR